MKTFSLPYAIAALCMLPIMTTNASASISQGSTYTEHCVIKSNCSPSHIDSNGTVGKESREDGGTYQAIQWIGRAFACTASSRCSDHLTVTSTGTTSWQIGVKLEVSGGVKDVASMKAEVSGALTKTHTDSDAHDFGTLYIKKGQSLVAYSYVTRAPYYKIYTGVWVRDADSYRCRRGFTNCYDYTWDNNAWAMTATYYKAASDEQTLTYKTYTTANGSGLKLEAD